MNLKVVALVALVLLGSGACQSHGGDELGQNESSTDEDTGTAADGTSSTDTDGETGAEEHWCDACNQPPPSGDACFADALSGWMSLSMPAGDSESSIDELCTVVSAAPELLVLDCPTYDPELSLNWTDFEWTPNLEADETVRFVALFDYGPISYGLNQQWRIEREDQSVALAGIDVSYEVDSVGLGAFDFSKATGVCVPLCDPPEEWQQGVVYEDVGLEFEIGGEQGTLFTGQHGVLGGYEYWVPQAQHRLCVDLEDDWTPFAYRILLSAS